MPGPLTVAILAAGASRRLGRPKQLVEIGGEPLVRRMCRIAVDARVGPVAVFLGAHLNACAAALDGLAVSLRFNHDWKEGLAASIREAARVASDAGSTGLLILHGDQFRITPGDLQSLNTGWRLAGQEKACRSVHDDYAGPPVILPSTSFADAMRLRGDEGARSVLAKLGRENMIDIEMPNAIHDLDLPEQLVLLDS